MPQKVAFVNCFFVKIYQLRLKMGTILNKRSLERVSPPIVASSEAAKNRYALRLLSSVTISRGGTLNISLIDPMTDQKWWEWGLFWRENLKNSRV